MNWAVLLVVSLVAGLVAAAAANRLERKRPGFGKWKRVLAAGVVPALAIAVLALIGIAWAHATAPAKGEGNREMVSFIIILVASILGAAALVGGLIGAASAGRRR